MKDNDSRRKIGIFGSVPIYALPLINSVNEMKALTGVSSFQGVNEKAFPSIPVIAERIGLSESATSTAISGLVRKGLVGRKRNYGRSNTYFLLYETESMTEIKLQNQIEKKKERAKRLAENIEIHSKKEQSFESLEYSNSSKHESSKVSNIESSNSSNDILKEQYKRTEVKEHTPTLSEQLKELAGKNGLTYSINAREQNLFQNKLSMEMGLTNDKILGQAHRFFEIVTRDKKQTWIHGFSFGFKFLQFNWDKIDAWHNANKPQVIEFKKPEPKEKPTFSANDLNFLQEFLA